MPKTPTRQPKLTAAEVEVAKREVTAFYDGEIARYDKEIVDARAALERAQTDRDAAVTARAAWTERGEITPAEATTGPVDPASRTFQFLVTEISLSAGSRAAALARPVIDARYGTNLAGVGRRPVTAEEQATADDAFARAKILDRWLRATGYPLPESL